MFLLSCLPIVCR